MKENSVSLTLFYLCYFNTHCLNSWTFLSFFSVWVCINTFQVLYLMLWSPYLRVNRPL
jgi:hypothetical protein